MSADYIVEYRSEGMLARLADKVRRLARPTGRYTIDIVHLIETTLFGKLNKTVGLAIAFFDGDKYDDPAFVRFHKEYPRVRLFVQRRVWEDARAGKDYAYFVLAHEVCHILAHDEKAVAFSNSKDYRVPYAPYLEMSAEWQADCFAKHLTMPDSVLQKTVDPDVLSILCNIELDTAVERIQSYKKTGPMLTVTYEGNPCVRCSNFSLIRRGTESVCEVCGKVEKEIATT